MQQKTMSAGERLGRVFRQGNEWIWAVPAPEDGRLGRFVRAAVRVVFIVFREFQNDRIPLRSSALTFTVVLSMVPMLALGTSVLKGLGAGDQMRQAAYALVERFESPSARIPLPEEVIHPAPTDPAGVAAGQPAADEPGGVADDDPKSMTSHLIRAVDQVFDYVDKTNFAALGAFGIFGLVLAVISVLGSIEEAMNCIWKADRARPMSRKILDYFALMIILPVTINLALATEATLHSPQLLGWFHGVLPVVWLGGVLLKILPLAIVIVTFSLLYRFLPNTHVQVLPAFAGGLVGGLGWLLVQSFYVDLQIGVSRYNAIYGSFATLPLFLLWLYAGWVIFLLGAEVAYAMQEWPGYVRNKARLLPSLKLAIAFTILEAVAADFHQRAVTSFASLAERIRQPAGYVRIVLDELVRTGLVRRVIDKEEGYLPAAPEGELVPAEVVSAVLGDEVADLAASDLAREALDGAKAALAGRTLVWPPPSTPAGD